MYTKSYSTTVKLLKALTQQQLRYPHYSVNSSVANSYSTQLKFKKSLAITHAELLITALIQKLIVLI